MDGTTTPGNEKSTSHQRTMTELRRLFETQTSAYCQRTAERQSLVSQRRMDHMKDACTESFRFERRSLKKCSLSKEKTDGFSFGGYQITSRQQRTQEAASSYHKAQVF